MFFSFVLNILRPIDALNKPFLFNGGLYISATLQLYCTIFAPIIAYFFILIVALIKLLFQVKNIPNFDVFLLNFIYIFHNFTRACILIRI